MKTKLSIILGLLAFSISTLIISSCRVSESVQMKIGPQLWAENCSRCHNSPSPTDFEDAQWTVIVEHMRIRANLTQEESEKILEFMKMAN